jgi:hypothetical protein
MSVHGALLRGKIHVGVQCTDVSCAMALTNRGDTHGIGRPLQCGVLVRKRHQLVARPNVKQAAGPVIGTAPRGVPI